MKDSLMEQIKNVPGDVGFFYKDISSGDTVKYNEDKPFLAASVIKIPILIETLKQIQEGKLKKDDKVEVLREFKVPSCGALTYMHDGLQVTIEDLYTLMIIHSDNTATNMLINITGIENINNTLESLGYRKTRLSRLLFDIAGKNQGKENYFTVNEVGDMLEKIYNRELISKEISEEMERVLKLQRLNHKIPYLLPAGIEVAHKTGEDSGITHDVGIVYSEKPFIFCFASNNTNVIIAEQTMQKMALTCIG